MSAPAQDFDPYSPTFHADPYPVYRRLRDEHPVFRQERLDFWALSRHGDVLDALQQPSVFCSSQGIAVGVPGGVSEIPMLIMMDPPRHTQLRALVSRAFTPRRIAALEPRIRAVARRLIGGFGERIDLVADYAAPLPTIVIAQLLGVPAEDQAWFKEKSNAVAQFQPTNARPGRPPVHIPELLELAEYLDRVIEERHREPRDDLISALVAAEIEGESLTRVELVGFAFLLLVAGNETTTNLISNGARLLDTHPGERERLLADPSGIPAAVEEFLRFDSPVQGLARTLTADVRLHDTLLPAGDKVLLLFASANRDERHFAEPERLDVARHPNPHLAFGFGAHFCLGASLARLEARVAFEELLARAPRYAVTDPRPERLCSGPIRGFRSLRVSL